MLVFSILYIVAFGVS